MALFKRPPDPTIPPEQHVTDGFPVLHVGDVPAFDAATWHLRFFGLCEQPFEVTLTRWSTKDTLWKGENVRHVLQHADNDYSTNLPIGLMLGDDCLVPYARNRAGAIEY